MKPEEYISLYNRLKEFEDIKKVHQETGHDEELLLVIYTQRFSRDITRNFYRVKAYTKKMVQDWDRKQSFMQIAKRWYFSPILTAYFIMSEKGVPRKKFWTYVRDPASARDKRLQREFEEIADNDMVYSPKGMEIQYARGRWGEAKLAEWLAWKGHGHRTEKDLKGKSAKTPDCLLDKPVELEGTKIGWIESKAIFGDDVEFRKNARKQLVPYTQMFGNGIVVYWFGFCTNLVPPDGVFIVDGKFFEVPSEGGSKMPSSAVGDVIRPVKLAGPGSGMVKPARQLPLQQAPQHPQPLPQSPQQPPPDRQRVAPQQFPQQHRPGQTPGGQQGERRGRRRRGRRHRHRSGERPSQASQQPRGEQPKRQPAQQPRQQAGQAAHHPPPAKRETDGKEDEKKTQSLFFPRKKTE